MSLVNEKGRLLAAPLAILLLSASGCAATKEAELHEAITKSISVSQKQTIESKISKWFGGLNITIANDAFSQTASITIERKAKVDSRGLPTDGRHNNPIYSFTLLSDGEQCVLRNDQNGKLTELENVTCYILNDI
ncbi:hypothetical protein [Alteromonas sp. S015]|uniref:hypothetical protein n=1 Tax=Alteromonas sp. S015 TaxID=3117401 RepID=UPI002FE3B3A2